MHHQQRKNSKIFQIKVKGLNIFQHKFLFTVYVDDTTFFLKDRNSIVELINALNTFSNFSGLRPNKTKSEIACIGGLNGVQEHSVA